MSDLASLFAPNLVDAIERLVDERVQAALQAHDDGSTNPWYSVAAAAEHLGVSERTVARLLHNGRIRSTTVGRRRLLHRDDLNRHLLRSRQP